MKKTVYFYSDPAYINNIRNGKEHHMTQRTSAYKFTTSDLNDSRIEKIKLQAKIINANARLNELITGTKTDRCRIVVRGRLGKDNVHAPLYCRGGEHYRPSSQTIKKEHASRFDVYLHFYTR
jgi:hypothetical protein